MQDDTIVTELKSLNKNSLDIISLLLLSPHDLIRRTKCVEDQTYKYSSLGLWFGLRFVVTSYNLKETSHARFLMF